jgi:hypothetical protein
MSHVKQVTLALFLLTLFCGIASAAAPNAPLHFTATLQQDPATGTRVHMTWTNDAAGAVPLYFAVMQASGAVQDISKFSKIQKVYAIADSNGGVIPDYEYNATGLKPGTYTFCVTAVNASGVSAPSAMQVITIAGGSSAVRWTSTPPNTGRVGVEFVYDGEAVGAPTNDVRYSGVILPSGATIDSLTGVLRYTANTTSTVQFKLKAALAADPTVYALQPFTVAFTHDSSNPQACGYIRGTVLDQNGGSVSGDVFAMNLGNPSGAGISGHLTKSGFLIAVPDSADYAVKVSGTGFVTEWYQDATSASTATPVHVRCGDTVSISITVQTLSTKTVSGVVLDADDQTPLTNAKVYAESATSQSVYARTDATGAYTLTLLEGVAYTLMATDLNGAHQNRYYNDVADKSLATVITLTGNLTGVDFHLPKKHSYQNGASGTVKDSAGAGIYAKVLAYRLEMIGQTLTALKAAGMYTDTVGTGIFSFTNLTPGTYVFYAWPLHRDLVPGYYKSGDYAVDDWANATQVTIDSSGTVTGLSITLRKRNGFTGGGVLRGTVTAKVGGFVAGGSTPLAEATVYIYDANGNVSDYATTDASGAYLMQAVPAGSVTFVADRAGYTIHRSTFSMPAGGAPVDRSAEMQPSRVTAVERPAAPSALSFRLHPNPATTEAIASFHAAASAHGSMTLYSVLGAAVRTAVIPQGATSVTLDLQGLAPGMYVVVATVASQTERATLRVVR